MERDTDLWLRGHVGTRDGRKGSSPLAGSYFLANSDFYRRIYSNGLMTIKAGPLLDIARANALTSGPAATRWCVDAGAQARITVLGTSVVLTWGHDCDRAAMRSTERLLPVERKAHLDPALLHLP